MPCSMSAAISGGTGPRHSPSAILTHSTRTVPYSSRSLSTMAASSGAFLRFRSAGVILDLLRKQRITRQQWPRPVIGLGQVLRGGRVVPESVGVLDAIGSLLVHQQQRVCRMGVLLGHHALPVGHPESAGVLLRFPQCAFAGLVAPYLDHRVRHVGDSARTLDAELPRRMVLRITLAHM